MPVNTSVYVPGGVAADVEMFAFTEPLPPVMTFPGIKLAVAPGGKPETEMVTFPVKPLRGETPTEKPVVPPAETDCELGLM